MSSFQGGKIMNKPEITIFPFFLGVVFLICLVAFLSVLDHAAVALGIYPADTAVNLLRLFLFY
jgi:hypothetical protein